MHAINKNRLMALAAVLLATLSVSIFLIAAGQTTALAPAGAPDAGRGPITVYGTVSGPNGPVANAWVGIGSPLAWRETSTNGAGYYSVSLETDGQLWFHVRPQPPLAQINRWMDGASGNINQNFTVVAGHTLDLGLIDPDGVLLAEPLGLEIQPLVNILPEFEWFSLDWNEGTNRYQATLPPDVYYVSARRPPEGAYDTTEAYDLRSADQTADMALNSRYVHPIPYEPPDASRITIGPADDLGEAEVTGAPGAVLPLAHVLLVNLNSGHQGHAISGAGGGFSGRLYAPPGSAVMIKHGPASPRWNQLPMGVAEGLNPFPGTIIHVPNPVMTAENNPGNRLSFAAAGFIDQFADDAGQTPNRVNSAWALTGSMGPVEVDGEWTRVISGTYDGETVPGLYLGGLNWTHPAPADLDGDGLLDLLVGADRGQLVLFHNQGTANAPDWRYDPADYAFAATGDWWAYPAVADVTGDGAPDLFVGHGENTLSVYYNRGTAAVPQWPEAADVTLATGFNAAPALADLDGDLDLDLLASHEGGTLYHFENTGNPAQPAWTFRTDSYAGIVEEAGGLQPAFVDLDGDDDDDLLIGLCGRLIWYEWDETSPLDPWIRHDGDPIGYDGGSCGSSPGVGDWNGDGRAGVVTGEHWGNLRFFKASGPATGPATGPAVWSESFFSFPFELLGDTAPALADWDDDGDLDMLVGQVHGDVYQYTNQGDQSQPDWRPDGPVEALHLPWTNHPHPFPTFADIDGDGKVDLFVGEGSWLGPESGGNIRYYHNDGTAAAPDWQLVTTSFLGLDVGGWSRPVFADIDDDNDLDLFIGDAAGTITFVENTGQATAPDWAAPVYDYAGLDLGSYSAPAFLDVNQDGTLDMLVGLEHGSLAYVRNTGTAANPAWEVAATTTPGIDVGQQATPATADLDGDGDPDLVIGGGDGGLHLYLYQGPGTPSSTTVYRPGDLFALEGTIRLHGQAISAQTNVEDIGVFGWMGLTMIADRHGYPLAAENYFMSTMLTPSGLPIQRLGRPARDMGVFIPIEELHYAGGHTILGEFSLTGQIPEDVMPGVYRPVIFFDFSGVPPGQEWLAANVTQFTFSGREALLPPITIAEAVGQVAAPRLVMRLLMDDFVQGTRGAGAREDEGKFALASQIVTQGAPFYLPPADIRTGQPITYRLEPFLPQISFTDRRMPAPPLIPLALPGGQLCVTIAGPDYSLSDLGCETLAQSFNRTKTTRGGHDLNNGTVQMEDVYSLMATSDRFRVSFEEYGHYVISMTAALSDTWGNSYSGGGTYDIWVAQPLDIDPGVLPGTPLATGDAFNPAMQFYPRLPAEVSLTVTHYPGSDPDRVEKYVLTGTANRFGYFGGGKAPIILTEPGEVRVDVTAVYSDDSGALYMGTMTWGSIVMTPDEDAQLVAHGRRGVDSLPAIPDHDWFKLNELDIPPGAISHTLNPYFSGDLLWTRLSDGPFGGDALVMGASVHDTGGAIGAAIGERATRQWLETYPPGSLAERFARNEIPLFSSTTTGLPVQLYVRQIGLELPGEVDQIAYSYRSSQRPGVRVREVVAEDGQSGGYWRLDTLYDDQLGVGLPGDQVNDFKYQYAGVVYRDLASGHAEYVGHGSGWIFTPDDDPAGSRVMPPFGGYGSWPDGGPILSLKGEAISMFILPTGVRPGAVLQPGDTFHFAGHLMPTLDSRVAVTVTAPSGAQHLVNGRANKIGYFYDPDDDFTVHEPGRWTVDVRVWHDGRIGTGQQVFCAMNPLLPCPSGDVLGSQEGRYTFYVVPKAAPGLAVTSPKPGFLAIEAGNESDIPPITITGPFSPGLTNVTVDYTITMPGFILEQGQATVDGDGYTFTYDPVALHELFPNLDLTGRDDWGPGLSDTIAIGLYLQGYDGVKTVHQATTITLQGEQVYVGGGPPGIHTIFLPVVQGGNAS